MVAGKIGRQGPGVEAIKLPFGKPMADDLASSCTAPAHSRKAGPAMASRRAPADFSRRLQKIEKPLEKIGLNIQQSAEGFTISRSEGGRTLFTVRAGKVVQLKLSGHATLEDVRIIVYGKDSSRYDQITGKRFEYDKETGDVTAQGR